MLRQVYIILNDEIIYQRNYAKGLDESFLSNVYPNIKKVAFSKYGTEFGTHIFFDFNLSYILDKSKRLIFFFISDLTDDFLKIEPHLIKLKKEFQDFYGESLRGSETLIDLTNSIVDEIHSNLKPKISIVGLSGVGKTTTTILIKSEAVPMEPVPNIESQVATIKIGKLKFFVWDFEGEEQFSKLWEEVIRGSDVVLLMIDSALGNLDKSRFFYELVNKNAPYARLSIIANKQDLPKAMKIADIERLMGKKTYPFIAIEPINQKKLFLIIADLLDLNPQLSPFLKPLGDRDFLINKSLKSLEEGALDETIDLFDEIHKICIEIGDESLAIEFQKKSDNLKRVLKSD